MHPNLHDHVSNPPLLDVQNLSVTFTQYESGLKRRDLKIIHELSLDVHEGEILAIVGSSGSGKSLFAHAIMGLLPSNAKIEGIMRFKGEDLTKQRQEELRGAELGFIPQSVNFLDPLMRVGRLVEIGLEAEEKLKSAGKGKADKFNAVNIGKTESEIFVGKRLSKKSLFNINWDIFNRASSEKNGISRSVQSAFEHFGLNKESMKKYPFQLSGGMARRVLVSSAILSGASLIIADEPTPGLDPALAEEAMKALRELADQGRGVVLITHDIDQAFEVADRIAVFYAGTALEVAPTRDFKKSDTLRHPYSKALWHALPQHGFQPIPGFQPYAMDLPKGCVFGPRCPHRTSDCESCTPAMRVVRDAWVRCCNAT